MVTHLNYHPFKCRFCSQRFSSILEFTKHGHFHADKKELDFIYDPKDFLDDWLQKITMYYQNEKHLKINKNEDCMICSKYSNYYKSFDYQSALFTMEDCEIDFDNEFKSNQLVVHPRNLKLYDIKKDQIRTLYHIHHHLQYYPYQCTLCKFRVPFIGKEFYDHLKKVHKVNFDFENHNADCFVKSFYIEQLDRMVEKFYKEIKDKKRDNRDSRERDSRDTRESRDDKRDSRKEYRDDNYRSSYHRSNYRDDYHRSSYHKHDYKKMRI